jgi:hypothetical protein
MRLGAPLLFVLHNAARHAPAFQNSAVSIQAAAWASALRPARITILGRSHCSPGESSAFHAASLNHLGNPFLQPQPNSICRRGIRYSRAMSAASGEGDPARPKVHCKEPIDFEGFVAALPDKDWTLLSIDGGVSDNRDIEAAAGGEDEHVFDAAHFHELLTTNRLGRVLLHGERIPSTQELLNDQLTGCPDGVVCVADIQSKGKGRGGNVWESPPGCLLFSFTSRVARAASLPFFQYLVSLAAHRAVSELCDADAKDAFALQLKWPNDIYAGAQKVGGVLCQTSAGGPAAAQGFQVPPPLLSRPCTRALCRPPPAPLTAAASVRPPPAAQARPACRGSSNSLLFTQLP